MERWWRDHPQSGDLLIGWVQHPDLAEGARVDLEAEFHSGSKGVWRSRSLSFQGPFKAKMKENCGYAFEDDLTTLVGCVRVAEVISGEVCHRGNAGGTFEFRAMPACYREWWAQVKPQVQGNGKPMVVLFNEDGSMEEAGANQPESDELPDLSSPAAFRNFLMKRIFSQGGAASPDSPKQTDNQYNRILKFGLTPEQVKAHLDRYVIRQNTAKEALAVAVCDHYNRAKEELLGCASKAKAQAEAAVEAQAAVAVDHEHGVESASRKNTTDSLDHVKHAKRESEVESALGREQVDQAELKQDAKAASGIESASEKKPKKLSVDLEEESDALLHEEVDPTPKQNTSSFSTVESAPTVKNSTRQEDSQTKKSAVLEGVESTESQIEALLEETNLTESNGQAKVCQVRFEDTDGDEIVLKLEGNLVNEYVNGELEIKDVQLFEIDEENRMYRDDTGSGSFTTSEDLHVMGSKVKALFKERKSTDSRINSQEEPAQLRHIKNYIKPNILLLGPTGSGKTYLLRNLAELIGVPFVKADATKFTETGYVGRDAEDMMADLLKAADGNVELAEVGIVYVDEIDKVCGEGDGKSAAFRKGTQSTFLKLMEDTEVTIPPPGPKGMTVAGMGPPAGTRMSTRHVLFVFSGAFGQLDERLRQEHERDAKGFGFASTADALAASAAATEKSMLHKATTDDLVKAGMEREFVGRIPVRVALESLSDDDLFTILTKAEEGATAQLVDDFRRYGVDLSFSDEALRAVAKAAVKEGTGARSLVTILEGALRRFKFTLPSLVSRGCCSLEVDEALIEKPDERLQQIIETYQEA